MQPYQRLQHAFEHRSAVAPPSLNLPVVVYGAGSCGRDVARVLKDAGYELLGFCDRSVSEARELDGLPCENPRSAQASKWRESGAQIVLGVWNCANPLDEIEADLTRLGWKKIWNFPRFYFSFAEKLGERFWLAPRDFYFSDDVKNEIINSLDLWSDELSRRLFAILLMCV